MSAVQANLRCRHRDTEGSADFKMRPAVNIFHHNHRPQTEWELTEGLAKPSPELELIQPALGLGLAAVLGFDDVGEGGLLMAGLTAPGSGRGVDCDAVQPGGESGIAPERRETSPRSNPGLLGDVGGEFVIAGETKDESVNLATVPLEQLGERRAVTLASCRDQF